MKILYYDSEIIVCQKPAGVLSEGEGENALPYLLSRELSGLGENNTAVLPVHRLDKETVGVTVFARTKAAAAALSESIRSGELKKQYLAVVHGVPEKPRGTLEDILFFDRKRGKSFVVDRERKGTKKAALDYELIGTVGDTSLLRIELHTGRTHQIRVQFSSRHLSLMGDRRYGAPKETSASLALVAYRLQFPHPKTHRKMEFFAEIPQSDPWTMFSTYLDK